MEGIRWKNIFIIMTVWEFIFQSSMKIGMLYQKTFVNPFYCGGRLFVGLIPDRIISLEEIINTKQAQLSNETNFELSCQLNHEIADLASIINDLWLWFRTDQDYFRKDASLMYNFSN